MRSSPSGPLRGAPTVRVLLDLDQSNPPVQVVESSGVVRPRLTLEVRNVRYAGQVCGTQRIGSGHAQHSVGYCYNTWSK